MTEKYPAHKFLEKHVPNNGGIFEGEFADSLHEEFQQLQAECKRLEAENLTLQMKLELAQKPLYSRRKLEAECKRYREALGEIAKHCRATGEQSYPARIAEQALTEVK